MARAELEAFLAEHKLSIRAEFVPFSQSRNKGEKLFSLNWHVTVERNGRPILITDYMAGQAYCPAYKRKWNCPGDKRFVIDWECENGRKGNLSGSDFISGSHKEPILPDSCDVFYSLAMESGVLDYATFEDWAGDFGCDPDSRKGEAIYRACMEHALKLRAALGAAGLAALQTAAQDY